MKAPQQSSANVRAYQNSHSDARAHTPSVIGTLDAYIDKYTSLLKFLNPTTSGTPDTDPAPEEQTSKAISLQTGVAFDNTPIGKSFGGILADVSKTPYHAGDTVVAQFVGYVFATLHPVVLRLMHSCPVPRANPRVCPCLWW